MQVAAVFQKQSVTADTAAPAPAPSAERTAQGDYSKTNVQVEGVDEADVVKTDGNYIYQVNGSRIIIASINPAEQMSITNIIKDDTVYFNPIEMYVDGDKLTVISNVSKKMPSIYDSAQGARIAPDIAVDSKLIMPYPVGGQSYVRCAVYNIADRSNPIRERVFEIEGSYISSRKIDDIVYMVTNKYMYYYRPLAELDGPVTPMLMDTAEEAGDYKEIPLTDVCYFPNFRECNYASISSLSINKPKEAAKVETFLGASNNIYVSKGNMYITTLNYDYNNGTQNTVIYKFSFDNGKVTFLAKQSVEGNVLNQFSMDEHNGNFRIATTSYSGRDYRMSNNLFILDSAMQKEAVLRV